MVEEMEYPDGATPLDGDEIEGLKFPHVTTRGELDHLEQANIEAGLLWLKRRKNTDILNDQFVRNLHKHLFGEVWKWAGNYRLTEKNIGVAPGQVSVQLRDLLDDVRFWFQNSTFHPIEAAVRFHHRMVYIHPFPNGNGRHAREMTNLLLKNVLKHPEFSWGSGNLLKAGSIRKQYIESLHAADQENYEPLRKFVRT